MQQSFFISFPFEEKSLNKPIEDLFILPENTLGAYILRSNGYNMRRITIYIPRMNYERVLTLSENSEIEKASSDISFFNFICSLQKCAIRLNSTTNSCNNTRELQIEIIASDKDVKFIKSTREKLISRNS